jgi:7-cyano-7-deazaguanine synthase
MADAEGSIRAVVLLSGGLDSATAAAIARDEGYECHALSFDYGQRHRAELDAARAVASALGMASHLILPVDLRLIGGSALTDEIAVPRHDTVEAIGGDIPVTYVPARNTVFLSLALARAEVLDAADLFIGVNAVDYSGYPDCRPAFVDAFQRLANLATRAGVEAAERGERGITVHAPLIDLTKTQIIERGLALGVDFALTHSCYDPDERGVACGRCDSCLLRADGFRGAGVPDPAERAHRATT